MKVIVVSAGYVPRMHTALWLGQLGLPVHVITHWPGMRDHIKRAMPYAKVHVTNDPFLLTSRNYALELVKPGEWFIGMDDNIQRVTAVPRGWYDAPKLDVAGRAPKGYPNWRALYHTAIGPRDILSVLMELRNLCEANGTIYGGFASTENPMFRANRLSFRRFVKSKLFVMRRVKGVWWQGGDYAHDSWMSAYVVAQYGRVVVNNYVHPHHKMYEAGGLGRDRRAKLDPLLEQIIGQFPGLVVKARGANSALRFAVTSDTGIQRWQQANGWPR